MDSQSFQQIHDAFRNGDLHALRAALADPSVVPNGRISDSIGACLVYAIYTSPLAFIRALLEIDADPNGPADDGFPPLIAALSCARDVAGAKTRTDVHSILRLLLSFGADPNQRGINDYTPLHMAVAARDALAVQILLDGGADPHLRTRIDECETPLDMAHAAGLADMAALLARKGQPLRQRLRSGLTLLADMAGSGDAVRRHHRYRVRLRMRLRNGDAVRWQSAPAPGASLEDDGETLITDVRIERSSLISGLFYGVDGMRVGGTRRLEIAPHLGYGEMGVPDVIPRAAILIVEITVLEAVE